MPTAEIERQARLLASENKNAEPAIEQVFWFPDEEEVRLVGTTPTVPESDDGELHPFYFRPDPRENLSAPSSIALIRPSEVGRLTLPRNWGDWRTAVELE
jgi:hypothetical protein